MTQSGVVLLPSQPDAPRGAIVFMLERALQYQREQEVREKVADEEKAQEEEHLKAMAGEGLPDEMEMPENDAEPFVELDTDTPEPA